MEDVDDCAADAPLDAPIEWISPTNTVHLVIFNEYSDCRVIMMSHSVHGGFCWDYEDPSQQWGSLQPLDLRKTGLGIEKEGVICRATVSTPPAWGGKHITQFLNEFGFTIYPERIPFLDSPLTGLLDIVLDIKPVAKREKTPNCVCGPNPYEGSGIMEDYYPYDVSLWLKDGDTKIKLDSSKLFVTKHTVPWIQELFQTRRKNSAFWYHEQARLLFYWIDQGNAYEFKGCHKLKDEYWEKYKDIFDSLPKPRKLNFVPPSNFQNSNTWCVLM